MTALVSQHLPLEILQIDQRGGRQGVMGCLDNTYDKMVLEDAKINKKNLSMVCTDVKKAFDSVAHAWIVKVLEMSGVPKIIQEFVQNIMKGWRITVAVNTVNGREQLEPIRVRLGIINGDTFVVKLFILCLNPIAWIIRGFEGYQTTHEKGAKITHLLL